MNNNLFPNNESFYEHKVIRKLANIKKKIYLDRHTQSRVDFVVIILENNLYNRLQYNSFYFTKLNLFARDFDTCFEMKDGDIVVAEIMKKAKANSNLAQAIKIQLGENCYKAWLQHSNNHTVCQLTLF